MSTQTLTTQSRLSLVVGTLRRGNELEVTLEAETPQPLTLHWGLRQQAQAGWVAPPQAFWPAGTATVDQRAVQTPFARSNGKAALTIHLEAASAYSSLEFVLFFPGEGRWDNNSGRNYQIQLKETPAAALGRIQAALGPKAPIFERVFDLAGGGQLATGVVQKGEQYWVNLVSDRGTDLVLHWGIALRSPQDWALPPESWRGANSTVWKDQAAETPFVRREGQSVLSLELPEAEAPLGIQFVLREGTSGERWINYRGGNFFVAVRSRQPGMERSEAGQHRDVADEIVRAETTHNSWTLMHRFNLCYDLLDRVQGSIEGQALLYVYLRFSAIRQLTWQRNYNTKPRELAHAQERLTQKLAEVYGAEAASRPVLRLTLATVGRGGEGQRIRDEILNIMHRHHVKEVSGHFLEEWHQKLHNNTTPDDMVICEAYLAFLRSNGNLEAFYRTLEAGGVTRQRLESFERPIRSHPDFVQHLKEGLIHDFQDFLKVLKASHSGTDFETAINAALPQLDGDFQGLLSHLWNCRNAQQEGVLDLVRLVTEARRRLSTRLAPGSGLRELLYLDLALEQMLRAAIERNIHMELTGDQLVDLIGWVLENLNLSEEETELAACWRHWERLRTQGRFGAVWSLHAKSVVDRIGRSLTAWIDHVYRLLQPKAEYLGQGFGAEPWTITLFSEEVIRGSSLGFVLSTLLRHLDPLLRRAAHIGNWQIISRGSGSGRVELVESLRSIQGKHFEGPTIVVADTVTGEEEIPEGVTAVIAPDVVDMVSHVAVRARNANVLFASCHDADLLQRLKSLRGHTLHLEISPGGDVVAVETTEQGPVQEPTAQPRRLPVYKRNFTQYAIPAAEFNEEVVGGKSCHLAQLRSRLPEWVQLPRSVALPFGVFEKVLSLEANRAVAKRCAELVAQTAGGDTSALAGIRETVADLAAPDELKAALRKAMGSAGIAWPDDWETAWIRIKHVWASKWNERAFLSRRRVGLPDEALSMAVLIQEVVPANYAFVIHTVNPSNGNRDELFAEIVLGLGETLVGNYPGRALSFVWNKTNGEAFLRSFPGKSTGLYGEGLIFRSDSSGEDLAGYAGAGLYDSVLLQPPRKVTLDYSQELLVWDEAYRLNLMSLIARVGLEVERLSESPQDIEGAVVGSRCYVVQTRPQVGLD